MYHFKFDLIFYVLILRESLFASLELCQSNTFARYLEVDVYRLSL